MRIHTIESNAGGRRGARNAALTGARAAARANRPDADRVTLGPDDSVLDAAVLDLNVHPHG